MKSALRKDLISGHGSSDPNVRNTSTEQSLRPEHRRSKVCSTSTAQPSKPGKWRWTHRPRCGRPYCADLIRILPLTMVPACPAVLAVVSRGPLQSASNFSPRQYSPDSATSTNVGLTTRQLNPSFYPMQRTNVKMETAPRTGYLCVVTVVLFALAASKSTQRPCVASTIRLLRQMKTRPRLD